MKTLVTGSTGYVGAKLVHTLIDMGQDVKCLVRSRDKFNKLVKVKDVELIEGDLNDLTALKAAVNECKEIYHLAAFADIWTQDPETYHRINVQGTRNLLDIASDKGVRKVVVTSTAGVMGPCEFNAEPVTEDTNPDPPFYSRYDQSKFEQERVAMEYTGQEMDIVIVNPSRIYGPGIRGVSNSVSNLIELFDRGKWRFIPGDGTSMGNYVFIEDVVQGHLNAMRFGVSGNRYILGGENISYSDFFSKLNHITQRNQKLFKVPVNLLMLWSHSEVFMAKVFNKKPMIVPAFVQKLSKNWNLSSEKSMRELHYTYTDLTEGINKTLEWIRNG